MSIKKTLREVQLSKAVNIGVIIWNVLVHNENSGTLCVAADIVYSGSRTESLELKLKVASITNYIKFLIDILGNLLYNIIVTNNNRFGGLLLWKRHLQKKT